MRQFQLFDSVKLKEAIALTEGGTAPEGTPGAIVEVFNDGEAYYYLYVGEPPSRTTKLRHDYHRWEFHLHQIGQRRNTTICHI